jgi:DNA-binding transcriptional ArsR family regulator
LAHPLRAKILQRLGERVASPGDLAVELGAPLGVVSYHVRMLRDYDCVELVRTEPRRGALQHFYKATARPSLEEDQWRTLPSGLRGELAGETLQALVADLGAAADAGALSDPAVVLSRAPLELDERGFRKLNKLLARTLDQALAIAAESSERRNKGAEVFPTEVGLLHFKRGA